MNTARIPVVVIVGAGFGGLKAAQTLRNAPVRVALVDRRNYHLFQPLLYQVATAGISPSDIAYPLRRIFRKQRNLTFRLAEVQHVDLKERVLETSTGSLAYDYLILAVGGETNYFGIANVARQAYGLKDIDEAEDIRSQVLRMFELAEQERNPDKRRAMLTFCVVGGGPTGVECAGALSELVRLVLVRDHPAIEIKDVRILLLEATHHLLAGFPPGLSENAAETLWRKHVEVRFGAQVVDYQYRRVELKSGEVIPAHTLIWSAGVRAQSIVESLGVEQASQRRVVVKDTFQLPGHDHVFVIGDAAYLEWKGRPLPMMAPVAIQGGELAARNIIHHQAGEPLEQFRYKDPGSLATIGRNAAVARVGRYHFSGFLAWVVWLAVHLFWLIGFRNRLLVLINWAWDYFFYERAVRLINPGTGSEPEAQSRSGGE